jgi:hypothetical protein
MKKYTFLFFLGLVASLFTACSDDDNLTDSITPAPESENFFANGMTFASQPGVRSITFTAGRAWQAALDEPGANNWCIVTPTRGEAGTVTVSITVNENESDDTRNVHLNLIASIHYYPVWTFYTCPCFHSIHFVRMTKSLHR